MSVSLWTCPECRRQFGRRNQSHGCSPALSLDEYFASGSAIERPIYDAVVGHLETVGPIRVEAVQVGIFMKKVRTLAELRPRRDRVVLSILRSRVVRHPKVIKTLGGSGRRFAHFIDLRKATDVDDQVRDWLTEGVSGVTEPMTSLASRSAYIARSALRSASASVEPSTGCWLVAPMLQHNSNSR